VRGVGGGGKRVFGRLGLSPKMYIVRRRNSNRSAKLVHSPH